MWQPLVTNRTTSIIFDLMLSLKYIITEEVTCVDAAEIMKCFEKWEGGEEDRVYGTLPTGNSGRKKGIFSIFRL